MTIAGTGYVEVRDHVLWLAHFYLGSDVRDRLAALSAGDHVELEVAGVRGLWEKMRDGKNGAPTPGFNPLPGPARDKWHALQEHRGVLAPVRVVQA